MAQPAQIPEIHTMSPHIFAIKFRENTVCLRYFQGLDSQQRNSLENIISKRTGSAWSELEFTDTEAFIPLQYYCTSASAVTVTDC